MAVKTKKRRMSRFDRLDAEYGRRMREEEKKQKVLAKKRIKEFTTITGSKKKTQWYY